MVIYDKKKGFIKNVRGKLLDLLLTTEFILWKAAKDCFPFVPVRLKFLLTSWPTMVFKALFTTVAPVPPTRLMILV